MAYAGNPFGFAGKRVQKMPRPCKRRRVCSMPRCEGFAPIGVRAAQHDATVMTLDEFETIRLIDLEGLTQEECAEQMNVARTTAQSIYSSARKKLAEFIVLGQELRISGGDYILCEENKPGHKCQCCGVCRRNNTQ